MRELLNRDIELDAAAIRELGVISGALRDSAVLEGGGEIARISDDLVSLAGEIGLASHFSSAVDKIELWYLFVRLKAAAGRLH